MAVIKQQTFQKLDKGVGRTFDQLDKTYLFFGGTAYLGINVHPEAIKLYWEGLNQYGINVGTSRNNNVQLSIYPRVEEYLANWLGFEASLVVSSGFLSGQLAIRSLTANAETHYAPSTHPALWLSPVSPCPTQPFSEWAELIIAHINQSSGRKFVVVSDTFASVKPSCYDFSVFNEVKDDKEIYFLLDDSHGFGVFQNSSIMFLRQQQKPNFHFIVIGSLAKGLGIDAGVVLGETAIIDHLRESPVYAGASPPPPAALHLLINGSALYEQQLHKLQERMEWFQAKIQVQYQSVQGFPVYCFTDSSLYHNLVRRGIVISSFSYPLPNDPLLNRVVITSSHTKEDVHRLVDAIHAS